MQDHFEKTKESVLTHIRTLFEEIESEIAMSHQEKYALLEDAFQQASDLHELRVAFEQWYAEHSGDLDLGLQASELWDQAIHGEEGGSHHGFLGKEVAEEE